VATIEPRVVGGYDVDINALGSPGIRVPNT
jgi:hypothetical protein